MMDEFDIVLTEEDKAKAQRLLYWLYDCVIFTKSMSDLPTCNDCGAQNHCPYVPAPGERVRYNCPHWEAMQDDDG